MAKTTWGFWGLGALLSVGVALFSYRYLPGVGPLPPSILKNLFARPWLVVHASSAATALLIGPFQFVAALRRNRLLHRTLGRTYVIACLLGGASGFIMAFGSTAGVIATVGFGSLAVIWVIANVEGWRAALDHRFVDHRAWMVRSFAMTFGAVTLRLYIVLLPLLGVSFLDAYRASSFLAWAPNLLLAELYLQGAFKRRAPRPLASPSP